jgi:hypothetical protein
MYNPGINPVEPRVFVEQTHEELTEILKQHDPIWVPKLKHFIELQEGAAFRYEFYVGAFLSAVTVLLFLLITRH